MMETNELSDKSTESLLIHSNDMLWNFIIKLDWKTSHFLIKKINNYFLMLK